MTTADDFEPFDVTEMLDRAAHDAERTTPSSRAGALAGGADGRATVGLRLVIDNAIANAVKHGGATEVRLAVSGLGNGSR